MCLCVWVGAGIARVIARESIPSHNFIKCAQILQYYNIKVDPPQVRGAFTAKLTGETSITDSSKFPFQSQ